MKKFIIIFCNRLIKLLANTLKGLCYVFHYIFPNKRFTIPQRSPALIKGQINHTHQIPKTIWQTNFTNRVTLPVYINYLFNRLMAPTYNYRYMGNEEMAEFIKQNYSEEIFRNYSKLQIGAAQADFWRVLVLNKLGGVYIDIDAHLVWPLGYTIKPDDEELYVLAKKGDISNYFFASRSENPNLAKIIDFINKNIKENKLNNIYVLTGPGVFNEILDINNVNTIEYKYACNQGNFTNEYFQYIDKQAGKWTREQEKNKIIKHDDN